MHEHPKKTGSWQLIRSIQKGSLSPTDVGKNSPQSTAHGEPLSQSSSQDTELTDTQHDEQVNSLWNYFFWPTLSVFFVGSLVSMLLTRNTYVILTFLFIASLALIAGALQFYKTQRILKRSNNKNLELERKFETLEDRSWELRESEERYRGLAEAFGDMIIHRDRKGKVTYANHAFLKAFNLTNDEIIGNLFTPKVVNEKQEPNKLTNTPVHELCIETSSGDRWFSWLELPVRDEITGENTLRTVARDITQQKNIELELREAGKRARAASHAKSRFLANVSHEMRTPLNGIIGMSGLLAGTPLSAEQKNYVNAVHDSGTSLLTLIEDILDTALIEADKLDLKITKTDIGKLIEEVCELLAYRAHAKNIDINSYVSSQVPPDILIDAGRIRQVLINLIGNAVKFTEKGGVYVELTTLSSDSDDTSSKFLHLQVIDTGPGIPESDQVKIFEEFEQADSESTRKYGGAGLGLNISRSIISEMNGEITLESEVGKGAKFVVTLPIQISDTSKTVRKNVDFIGQRISLIGGSTMTSHAIEAYVTEQGGIFKSWNSYTEITEEDVGSGLGVLIVDYNYLRQYSEYKRLMEAQTKIAKRTIVLIQPEQRDNLNELLSSFFDAYLIKPLRKVTLFNVLSSDIKTESIPSGATGAERFAQALEKSDEPKRILLAEDNDINALLARSVLEKVGHSVVRAQNGEEALSILRKKQDSFHLIFMDLQMPVMDGITALKHLRQEEKDEGRMEIPVYILTADEQSETQEAAEEAGANGFLTKPLNPNIVLKIVNETILS